MTAPAAVRSARWSLEPTVPPCCRVAYLVAGARRFAGWLRIVAGDGSGDRRLAQADPRVAPAWRPGDRNRALAYVDPSGAVRLVAADSGRERAAPYHHGFRPTLLAWSADGSRLLAMNPVRLVVLDTSLHPIGNVRRPGTTMGSFTTAAFATRGHAVLLLRRLVNGRALSICCLPTAPRARSRRSSARSTACPRRPTGARCSSAGAPPTSGCSCRRAGADGQRG